MLETSLSCKICSAQQLQHLRMAKHLPIGLRELIGLEGLAWLISGIVFGYFAGKGASLLILAIPIAIFVVWLLDWLIGCKADHSRRR